jgi:carbamoyl-phosphate synthase small subunit
VADALLVLEDGSAFPGRSFGASGDSFGEIVFNTAMSGYQEVVTDPSYAGQIVVMTYPHQGNYGTNGDDPESDRVRAAGLVVREAARRPSSWRAERALPEELAAAGVIGIEDVDTRELTLHIRERGAMRAAISTTDLDPRSLAQRVREQPEMLGADLARTVSAPEPYEAASVVGPATPRGRGWGVSLASPGSPANQTSVCLGEERPAARGVTGGGPAGKGVSRHRIYRVAAYDWGIKRNILRLLARNGCETTVFPAETPAEAVLRNGFDGVFLSNGPGDPAATRYAVKIARTLLGNIPVFGICLGHQIVALAAGGRTYKLKFGHRGANQPVLNLDTGRVEVTSHNHGFAVDPRGWQPVVSGAGLPVWPGSDPSLGWPGSRGLRLGAEGLPRAGRGEGAGARGSPEDPPTVVTDFGMAALTHWNLNDGTLEGLRLEGIPAFTVQYHPEAAPGPHDSRYLFQRFLELMEGA